MKTTRKREDIKKRIQKVETRREKRMKRHRNTAEKRYNRPDKYNQYLHNNQERNYRHDDLLLAKYYCLHL